MARIGIDAHAIGERLTGNETYISNLIDGLAALESGHEFVLFFTREKAAEQWRRRHRGLEVVMARPSQPVVRIPLVMPWLVRRHKIDLLHVQYAGPPFMATPLITAIHDISYERYPEYFSRREVLQFRATIPWTARKARRVLTISECSKRDLVEIYGIQEDKVIVIYLGVSAAFAPLDSVDEGWKTVREYGASGRYILAVGNLQPRKNLVRLIAAYTRLRNNQPEIRNKLLIVGKKAWKHDPILEFARQTRWVDDIIFTGYVPDKDLPVLYGCADALVYPSIYEGFGLPPLEAMACGTPVVVSDRSSLPEVVGDAGLKVDPFDVDAIAQSMAVLLTKPEVARRFSTAGLERANQFRWADCARKTLEVYEEVCRETETR